MKRICVGLMLLCVVAAGCQNASSHSSDGTAAAIKNSQPSATPKYASFGAPMKLPDSDALSVQQLMADPKAYDGKYVRVSGTVEKVCPRKGCWMTLQGQQPDQSLFVKFPDPPTGRLIPMDAAGKQAIVEGTVKVRMIPEAEARHYKQEAGASQEELAKITGPQPQVRVSNGSAQVQGVDAPAAR